MSLLRAFTTGEDRPPLEDQNLVNRLYKRHRLRIMMAITIGYGLVYTCRLALSMVKHEPQDLLRLRSIDLCPA
jgi:OPA family sugar phosphate sensor protein UhpC-like MFS transporter